MSNSAAEWSSAGGRWVLRIACGSNARSGSIVAPNFVASTC